MNSSERMDAAINLQPVDRVPNAPFYEAPICRYFGSSFREVSVSTAARATETHSVSRTMIEKRFTDSHAPSQPRQQPHLGPVMN